MKGACRTYGGRGEEAWRMGPPWKPKGNIKIDIQEIWFDGVEYIDLGQDKDKWRATVNTVMNLLGP